MRHLPALKEVPCIKNLRLVFSVPIPLRTQLVRTPTRRKGFLRNYGKFKSGNEHLIQINRMQPKLLSNKKRVA